MDRCEWSHGQMQAAVHPHGLAVLPAEYGQVVRELWQKFDEGTTLTELLQILTQHCGADLTALPSFALLVREDTNVRVAVRGTFRVQVRSGRRLNALDGGALLTWTEHHFETIDAWRVDTQADPDQIAVDDGLARDAVLQVSALSYGDLSIGEDEATEALEAALAAIHLKQERRLSETGEQRVLSPQGLTASDSSAAHEDNAEGELHQEAAPEYDEPVSVSEEEPYDAAEDTHVEAELPGKESYAVEDKTNTAESLDSVDSNNTEVEEQGDEISFHDGHTVHVNVEEAQVDVRTQVISAGEDNQNAETPSAKILAVTCPDEHANPPYLQQCRVCDQETSRNLIRIERPSLGRLVLSTGETIEFDRDVIFGSDENELRTSDNTQAYLVVVDSGAGDVAPLHCEFRISGWDARIRDLGSEHGTFLTHMGQSSNQVEESYPEFVKPGDVIKLGQSLTIRLES